MTTLPHRRHWLHRHRFLDLCSIILAISTVVFGAALILGTDRHTGPLTRVARDIASIPTWGCAFILSGLVAAIAARSHVRAAHWPMSAVTIIWCAWTLVQLVSVPANSAAPAPAIASLTLALLSAAATIVYAREPRQRGDQ